jgi:hypothetical protein
MLRKNFVGSLFALAATGGLGLSAWAASSSGKTAICRCGDGCKCEVCGCAEGACTKCGCTSGGCAACRCDGCGQATA